MIYTSYFGNYRNFGDKKVISIARYSPKHYKGENIFDIPEFRMIVPTTNILFEYKKGNIDKVEYAKRYIAQLMTIDFEKFLEEYFGYILLCYETTGDFCHRQVLSFYAKRNFNYIIKELGK